MSAAGDGLSPPDLRRTAIDKLISCQRAAGQLNSLIKEACLLNNGLNPEAGHLMEEVLNYLAAGITALRCTDAPSLQQQPEAVEAQIQYQPLTSESKGRKRRSHSSTSDGKGGHRRRRGNENPWTQVTTRSINDGHTWRKYGQKDIFNAKFPRSYFRCSHKYDRGCQAIRQVQPCEEDPSLYIISYMGDHTCKDQVKLSSNHRNPQVISFGSTVVDEGQEEPPVSGSLTVMAVEGDDEVLSKLTGESSMTGDGFQSPEVQDFDGFMDQMLGSFSGSSSSLGMSLIEEAFDFGEIFNFGGGEYLKNY